MEPAKPPCSSAEFYRAMGWGRYVALDVAQRWPDTLLCDLDQRPEAFITSDKHNSGNPLTLSFDLVVNNGTGEHIFNQASVFEWAHELARPGALMLHILPFAGWHNHGFYSYHPILFRDLAAANGYAVEGLYVGERNGRLERLDGVKGMDPFEAMQPFKQPRPGALERAIASFGERGQTFVVALLRKPAGDTSAPFRAPIQGKYQNDIADPAIASERGYESLAAHPLLLRPELQVVASPFPHIIVENALPEALYAELLRNWPDPALWLPAGAAPNTLHHMAAAKAIGHPQIPRCWQRFMLAHTSQRWLDVLLALFGAHLPAESFPPHGSACVVRGTGHAPLLFDVQFAVNTPVREAGSVRGPHVDSPDELIAGLFYMPIPGDEQGGDLVLYEPSEQPVRFTGKAEVASAVREVGRVLYRPNTAIFFVNTPGAIHGVSERALGPHPRRYVNVLLNAGGESAG